VEENKDITSECKKGKKIIIIIIIIKFQSFSLLNLLDSYFFALVIIIIYFWHLNAYVVHFLPKTTNEYKLILKKNTNTNINNNNNANKKIQKNVYKIYVEIYKIPGASMVW